MPYRAIRSARFGGPEVLELAVLPGPPEPGAGEVLIKVQAAGAGFTDTFIRRGRYPDVKGPLPITLGYELVGTVEAAGPGVAAPAVGQMVADLCVIGGYAQYALRPAAGVVVVPDGIDPAEAVCIPLAYLTGYQMLTRLRALPSGARILVVGASGTVGTALLDLARVMGLRAFGTCARRNMPVVERLGATAIDYADGDFVATVRRLTGGRGVDAAFDAIGGAHFARSFATLAKGGLLVGYGAQTMATGRESLLAAGLGMARLKLWGAAPFLFGGRGAVFYSITAHRTAHPDAFKTDMATLFDMLRRREIHPIVVDRVPLTTARAVHARIDAGGVGGKIVLLPWAVAEPVRLDD
ncbi:zinc-binding dehydrogenase [Acidisphaera rubrifaciens]|uniref:Alcohol dehydrogenase n=1 Tax=Acidisphaera rubrifaciens HS-AP3 TaxID=1231350 RepID=A0A0D6P613_9PROT|nr:zinc-binding dehydrogenase [Acidisphaera rubrifaciens]GAN77195.1 alcohol dehydrogenase [Acidisphaera rubrifaciens HS-AP3]